jgi:adenylosuccinate synthase
MFGVDDTNFVFEPGKLTILLDGGAGSSGKGKLGAFVTEHANNWQFCCNGFSPQAGHWVKDDDGKEYFYQTLNSCAYQPHYEKMYLGPGAIIELPALFREIEENGIEAHRLGISPVCAILQDQDAAFERGEVDLDGNKLPTIGEGTMKHGSTCHGVGAALARRRLRRPDAKLARDIPELAQYMCDVPGEIMNRLDAGQAGFLEIAQGFQLSYLIPEMYPYCTSRNCTVAAGLDDMMLPPSYAGNVLINYRTFPIRISNYKYISRERTPINGEMVEEGDHLTWDQVQQFDERGLKYEKYEGNSGPGYPDQEETDWDTITKDSGSLDPIIEMTSVTKLPRRAFTFSKINVEDSVKHNKTNGKTFISINFANYVDASLLHLRRKGWSSEDYIGGQSPLTVTGKMYDWCRRNIPHSDATLSFIGTGPRTDDFILV